MPIDTQHSEYKKHLSDWEMVKDCCEGQSSVKSKKDKYLRPMSQVSTSDPRYLSYIARANFVNFTGRTKEGLTGAVFREDPEIELPSECEYLLENADGAGETLISLAKDVTGEVVGRGRHVLLVDYPPLEANLTAEQIQNLSPQATINRYNCESLINWRVDKVNGQKILGLAVLKETYNASSDEFEFDAEIQYRVLRLTNGVYSQQVYRENKPFEQEIIPLKADGTPFSIIPMFIIGAENNDSEVDTPPLADIAHLNIGHYRNSADLEENCFVHGQLTLGVSSSMSHDQFEAANPNGIVVGAMAGHFLGEGGSFSVVQAEKNQLADHLMERKESQMRKLGARMISEGGSVKTATQSLIEQAGETSILTTIADNVSEGIQQCINWCGEFMGAASEALFKLNTEFFDDTNDPQMLMAAMQLNEGGVIAKSDMQNLARDQGVIKDGRTNEDIDAELIVELKERLKRRAIIAGRNVADEDEGKESEESLEESLTTED